MDSWDRRNRYEGSRQKAGEEARMKQARRNEKNRERKQKKKDREEKQRKDYERTAKAKKLKEAKFQAELEKTNHEISLVRELLRSQGIESQHLPAILSIPFSKMLKQAHEEMEYHGDDKIEDTALENLYHVYLREFNNPEAKSLLESFDENHHDRKAVAWFVTHWLNKGNQHTGDKMYYELIRELREHPVLGKNEDYYHDRAKYAEKALKKNIGENYKNVDGLGAFGHSLYDCMLREEERRQPVDEEHPAEHGKRVRGPALAESFARQRFEKWASQMGGNFNGLHDFEHKKFEWMEPLAYNIYLKTEPGVDPSDVIDNFHRLNSRKDTPHHEKTKFESTVNAITDNELELHNMKNIPYLGIVSKAVLHGMYNEASRYHKKVRVTMPNENASKAVVEKRREAEWMKCAKDAFQRNYIDKLTKDKSVKNTLNNIFLHNHDEENLVRYLDTVIPSTNSNFVHKSVKEHAKRYRPKFEPKR